MEITTKFSIGDKVCFNETHGAYREICRYGYVKSIDIAVESGGVRIKYFVCIPYNIGGLRHECYSSILEHELRKVESNDDQDQVQPQ